MLNSLRSILSLITSHLLILFMITLAIFANIIFFCFCGHFLFRLTDIFSICFYFDIDTFFVGADPMYIVVFFQILPFVHFKAFTENFAADQYTCSSFADWMKLCDC